MGQGQSLQKLGYKVPIEKKSTADLQDHLAHLRLKNNKSGLNPDQVRSKQKSPRSLDTTPSFDIAGAQN